MNSIERARTILYGVSNSREGNSSKEGLPTAEELRLKELVEKSKKELNEGSKTLRMGDKDDS